ncbi:MAG: SDR family oxidoreductase [Verrucomicrobia bacterium]|nr:SDR family oxidoreductase [Verrucomicrobiota bacterium]
MSTEAERRVVLITGVRKGIGRFLAEHYLERGWQVVGCSRTAADLRHERFDFHAVDVGDEAQVTQLVRAIGKRYGRLDAVINNAGVGAMNAALLTPAATAHAVLQTNFLGTFLVCREGAKLMMKRRVGRIVNLTTVAVPLRLEGESVYAAAKSAVESFTRVFAREVGEYGITVNAIGPSPIETDLIRGVPRAKLDALVDRLTIKRFGTLTDVANVVDFLLRPESDAVTGQVIYLGGAG